MVRTPLRKSKRILAGAFVPALLFVTGAALRPGSAHAGPPDAPPVGKPSPLLSAMKAELDRSFKTYGAQDPAAYFIGYTITDTQRLQVSVRTGDYTLDNSHKVGEQRMPSGGPGTGIPVDNDEQVVRRAIWLETDSQYRNAAEALIKIRSSKEVKADTAEGRAPDFSHEQPHQSIEPEVSFTLDRKPWEAKVRTYTKTFRESPDILNSIVTFSALAQNSYLVNSEGTQLQSGQIRYRLELFIQGKATDGMNIERYYNFDWVDPNDAPSDKDVQAASATLRKEMEGLVKAPLNEPTVGPALLTGRAAAVFFHEVFGHRAEGHRQKDISEGQTFAKKVG